MTSLKKFEHKIYSQNGEDGIIALLLDCVGRDNKYFVEFGVQDGTECNTRYLREHANFTGLMMDGGNENHAIGLYKEMVTVENINHLFNKYKVPTKFEILSIDIDGNDLWVWQAIDEKYQPKIVVMEYNPHLPPPINATIPYSIEHRWDGTCFYGASVAALNQLAQEKNYTLVYCDSKGVNAFFIHNQYLKDFTKSFTLPTPETAFIPAYCCNTTYGETHYKVGNYQMIGHGRVDQSQRQFVEYPSGKSIVIPEIDVNFSNS
ncbi:hypothetical protein Lepto7376_1322 [[Leptolyngbya] sp. PCC 7376]|uniref:hypothetical protein n=1 Tax=[Leptolyngbya] sp. PCC 7376 TaxID=111781 RepID=UPI00029F347C|nr:hypothetical protein [[Leptolyngbya] sp. PCC 7376]AFY37674.1 hypothetical protein Lepto7376_1322 [[Leptolyngbya] sp. PCC 7376]